MTTDERRPLLNTANTPDYSSAPKSDEPADVNKLSYNKVGLSVNRFWLLFSECIRRDRCRDASGSDLFFFQGYEHGLVARYFLVSSPQSGVVADIIACSTGNLLCAVSPSMEFLIAARALAGMGGGGLSTIGSTIMSDIVPITHRGIYQGFGNLAFGGGMGLGAPLGGIINDYLHWRWAFGIQLFRRIDFLGCFLLAGWVGAALIAVSLKTNSTSLDAYTWSDPLILALFGVSAVLFALFLLVELKWASEPVMPFELLNRRTAVSVAINNFSISMAQFALKYYWLNFWSGLMGLVGAILISMWNRESSEWMLWTNLSFTSFAMGAVTTLTIVALIADVGHEHVAIATSLSYVFRTIGQVLGVALSGALAQAILQKELSKRITGPGAEDALHAVFLCAVILSVIYLLAGLGIREIDMHKAVIKPANGQGEEEEEDIVGEVVEAP
ncbi:hypothetical protein V866_006733 [Kwoniella sp. B9012]